MRALSLFWKLFGALTVVLSAAFALVVLSPRSFSLPMSVVEAAELAFLYALSLGGTAYVLARGLGPLRQLRAAIEARQALTEPERVPVGRRDEVGAVAEAYNGLLDRLSRERRRGAGMALAAQEAERRRVARELHDQVGQSLTVVLLRLRRLADLAPAEMQDEVATTQEITRDALTEVRGIAARLRPGVLEDLGLTAALTSLTTDVTGQSGLRVHREIASAPGTDADQDLVIYRVAQEALTNVLRHAGATSVSLRLVRDDSGVTLTVADDGRGIDGPESSGMIGMRERALLVGGSLSVTSPEHEGTSIRLHVPIGAEQDR